MSLPWRQGSLGSCCLEVTSKLEKVSREYLVCQTLLPPPCFAELGFCESPSFPVLSYSNSSGTLLTGHPLHLHRTHNRNATHDTIYLHTYASPCCSLVPTAASSLSPLPCPALPSHRPAHRPSSLALFLPFSLPASFASFTRLLHTPVLQVPPSREVGILHLYPPLTGTYRPPEAH